MTEPTSRTDAGPDAAGDPAGDPDAGAPTVHGVLVTYRRTAELVTTLAALRAQTRPIDRLVVVDNDPTGTAAAAVEAHARAGATVEHLVAPDNLGPAGGIAVGLERVLDVATDDDLVVLLDDDDPPGRDDLVERLVDLLARASRIAASTSSAPVAGVAVVGARFDRRRGRLVRLSDAELVEAGPLLDVDYLGGSQLPVYRVAAVRSVGVFDARLFWGYDDLDYGLRLRRAGWRLVVDGSLAHWARAHFGRLGRAGAPSGRLSTSAWRRYYTTRNLVYVLAKHGLEAAALRQVAASGLAKPLVGLPRQPAAAARQFLAAARGVGDVARGRLGRRVEPGAKPGIAGEQR